ncbi:MAG: D-2-hydroxyacid dehydrogenase [Pseudomonadota bacterium]
MKIVINGADSAGDVPCSDLIPSSFQAVYVNSENALAAALPGAEVLVGWAFADRSLENCFRHADRLKWVHCCSAGVDAVMFPALQESDVIVTNSRGLFDKPMAEYLLGYMLGQNKKFNDTRTGQVSKNWAYQETISLQGQTAVIFGVGSIGREFARYLKFMGVGVSGVGRRYRENDPDFGTIFGAESRLEVIKDADWVVAVMPDTPETHDYFDSEFFNAMKVSSRFVNLGRGTAVDETALAVSLNESRIAGALLDVFKSEPLPVDHAFWECKNLMISPHMSGDFQGYREELFKIFIANLERYSGGLPLQNPVDTRVGFAVG